MKRLTTKIKLLYGLGFSAQGIKDGLFQLFLFFYFSQVLGLDPALAGLTTFIALLFDAVSDPVVGVISDNWKSEKWGRRHPFMFLSAIPMGVSTYFLFLPPTGMGQLGLFWWLTIFTILVRLSLTLFIVPGMSLGAELTTDYEERTSVTSYRVMFSGFIPAFIIIFGLLFFFTPKPGTENGMMNADAYPAFAFLCGVLIILCVLISTYGTKSTIPNLPQSQGESERANLRELLQRFVTAFTLKSYRTLVLFIMAVYIAIGIGVVFTPYFINYYFAWSEKELALLPISSGVGGLMSLLIAPMLGKRLDKKRGVILSTFLVASFFSLPYMLKVFGLLPGDRDPFTLPFFILCATIGYTFLFVVFSLTNSMMADVADDYDLMTGKREEGLFFSTMSFAYKCTVGIGYLFAGILLKIIAFPTQVSPGDVPADKLEWLGIIGGPVLFITYAVSILWILSYPITKSRYQDIRQQLQSRLAD